MEQKEQMVTMTFGGKEIEVNIMLHYFIELLRLHGDDVSDISGIINGFQDFIDLWDDFKKSKRDHTYQSKNLQRFNLFHTIKPKTEYAHQQAYDNGKALLYPIYRIENQTVYSMAPGGNYPLEDCVIYVGDGVAIQKIT